MTIDIDTSRANQLLDRLAHELGKGAVDAVKEEARLLSLELIRRTPPKSQAQGEKAIGRDLSKLFTSIDTGFLDRIGSEYGTKNISHWITMADGRRVQLQWDVLDPEGRGMAQYHEQSRNAHGRIPRTFTKGSQPGTQVWRSRYVVTKQDFASYLKIVQGRVGIEKSGWQAGLTVGGGSGSKDRVPNYVSRHGNQFGSVQTSFGNPDKASVTLRNHAPGIVNTKFFVELAVKSRRGALAARLRRVIAGIKEDLKK
jgi:hypothetical protein